MTRRRLKRGSRPAQRGVTLIELMVGFTIAILLTLAAVSFAAHETRLMGISRDRLDLAQASRAAIDLLADDLKQAGAGIGYQADGTYRGLMLGSFMVDGVVQFNPDGGVPTPFDPGVGAGPGVFANVDLRAVGEYESQGAAYVSVNTDVGILTANGNYATIAEYNLGGTSMYCRGANALFDAGERVVLRSEEALDAFNAVITPGNDVACNSNPPNQPTNGHDCINGCTEFTFQVPPTVLDIFSTAPGAQNRGYLGGEIGGGLKTIVWFVLDEGNGTGSLRRAIFDATTGCAARDNNCGGNVVGLVESFVVQAWTFDATAGVWTNAGQQPIQVNDRIRVDAELVVRSRKSADRQTMPVPLNLVPAPGNCIPSTGACNVPQDFGQRRVIRTSVEIKNSGI